MCCEKYLKDSKHNSLHLAQKYAWIFVLGHIFSSKLTVFLELLSRKIGRFSEQMIFMDKIISEHISVPNGGYCLFVPVISLKGKSPTTKRHDLKNWHCKDIFCQLLL